VSTFLGVLNVVDVVIPIDRLTVGLDLSGAQRSVDLRDLVASEPATWQNEVF
jgi:hypothetical protein